MGDILAQAQGWIESNTAFAIASAASGGIVVIALLFLVGRVMTNGGKRRPTKSTRPTASLGLGDALKPTTNPEPTSTVTPLEETKPPQTAVADISLPGQLRAFAKEIDDGFRQIDYAADSEVIRKQEQPLRTLWWERASGFETRLAAFGIDVSGLGYGENRQYNLHIHAMQLLDIADRLEHGGSAEAQILAATFSSNNPTMADSTRTG